MFFLYVTNAKSYQQKTGKSFISEEKSFIGSAPGCFLQANAFEALKIW